MKLKDLLKIAGISFLISSCMIIPAKDEEKYKNMFFQNYENTIILGWDTDKDNYEDLRHYYQIVDMDENMVYLELIAIQGDKNRNLKFENNEFIWKKKMNPNQKRKEEKGDTERKITIR